LASTGVYHIFYLSTQYWERQVSRKRSEPTALENESFEDVRDLMRITKQSRGKLYLDMQRNLLVRPIKLGRKSVWLRSQRVEYMRRLIEASESIAA
jgi:predicted DNA-binding transcriptional regulator AlpA